MSSHTAQMEHAARGVRGIDPRKLGMWFFLGSEVMFFSGLISTFLHYKVQYPDATHMLDVAFTTINTFLLLTSSFTVVRGLEAIRNGNRRGLWSNMVATFLLGLMFLMGQALEFAKLGWEGLTQYSVFASGFFTTTSFHGFHVFVGLLWTLLILVKIFTGRIRGPEHAMQIEIFGLYWHFVDVVWIILFTIIYLIR